MPILPCQPPSEAISYPSSAQILLHFFQPPQSAIKHFTVRNWGIGQMLHHRFDMTLNILESHRFEAVIYKTSLIVTRTFFYYHWTQTLNNAWKAVCFQLRVETLWVLPAIMEKSRYILMMFHMLKPLLKDYMVLLYTRLVNLRITEVETDLSYRYILFLNNKFKELYNFMK